MRGSPMHRRGRGEWERASIVKSPAHGSTSGGKTDARGAAVKLKRRLPGGAAIN